MFKDIEECEQYILKETQRFVYEELGLKEKVTVIFDDDKVSKTIATCNYRTKTIVYYEAHFKINLDNIRFINNIIGHECIHLVEPNHGRNFKAMCRMHGITPEAIQKTIDHNHVPITKGRISFKCGKCGKLHTFTKNKITRCKQTMITGYITCDCGAKLQLW